MAALSVNGLIVPELPLKGGTNACDRRTQLRFKNSISMDSPLPGSHRSRRALRLAEMKLRLGNFRENLSVTHLRQIVPEELRRRNTF